MKEEICSILSERSLAHLCIANAIECPSLTFCACLARRSTITFFFPFVPFFLVDGVHIHRVNILISKVAVEAILDRTSNLSNTDSSWGELFSEFLPKASPKVLRSIQDRFRSLSYYRSLTRLLRTRNASFTAGEALKMAVSESQWRNKAALCDI